MKACYPLILVAVVILFASSTFASDIPALQSIAGPEQAQSVCDASCAKHNCVWSGEWRKGEDNKGDICDCGYERIRSIPAGVIRTEEQAKQACTELCTLNENPWTGKWTRVPGAFDLCDCRTVSEWCEPKK